MFNWRTLLAQLIRTNQPQPHMPTYMVNDLWQALGLHADQFTGYVNDYGLADTWGILLSKVRDDNIPTCGHPTDDGPCVLRRHDPNHPHYAATDVGTNPPLPTPGVITGRRVRLRPLDTHGNPTGDWVDIGDDATLTLDEQP